MTTHQRPLLARAATRAATAALASALILMLSFAASSAALAQAAPTPATQQQQREAPFRITYQLSMPRPASHLFEVKVEVEAGGAQGYVELQMPRWSPGRYGVFEFAKNVQEFRATAGICPPNALCDAQSLPVRRMNTQTWRVSTRGAQSFTAHYKVFANDLSGTFSQLDSRHANYNGHSIFMYVAGHKPDPVRLRIDAPAGWRIINGYTARPDQREWQFPNYDVMVDAPTEIAPDWTVDEFRVGGKSYRVVVHSFGDEGARRPSFVRDVEKIVRAEVAMMGEPDFDSYTFIFHFDPTASRGDGMEHLTSTQIISTRPLAAAYNGALDTAAHEFFHVWNVKRLRPAGLGPWDFTRPVETRELWIAEGFTNYYGNVMLRRAGLRSNEEFMETCAATITDVEGSPGNRLMSAEEASLLAPFLDRSTHEQHTNLDNTAVSYYTKGEELAIVLDLLVRGRSRGRASLDDVMRRMYEEFYLKSEKNTYYLRGRNYTVEDFERVTSEVTGTDMSDFFTRYVRGVETPPFEEAFAYVGLRLVRRPAENEPFSAGILLDWRDQQQARISAVRPESAAERAGLQPDDMLVTIGSTNVTHATWRKALNAFKQGDRVPVSVRRGAQTIRTSLTLGAPDSFRYTLEEMAGATAQARSLRASWLK